MGELKMDIVLRLNSFVCVCVYVGSLAKVYLVKQGKEGRKRKAHPAQHTEGRIKMLNSNQLCI
jgi:hypothetical protein